MSKLFYGSALVAVLLLVGLAGTAEARCCGARTGCCETACAQPCQQVVYQQKQYTCYRTCYEPVWEQKTVTAVRYEYETHYRECVRTVCRPVYETAEREVCYTVCKPVREMQTVKVCGGHWENRQVETCKPAACEPCACGPAQTVQQCRVWVPEMIDRQVECVRYVNETVTRKVPYQVCRLVSEEQKYQVPYQVCKEVPYQTTVSCMHMVAKQVPYTVTRCEAVVVPYQPPVPACAPAAGCCR
jgi:hypothetical protein